MIRLRNFLVVSIFAVAGLSFAGSPGSIANILPTAEGTTMTLAGTAAGWKDSWKTSAPNTFYLSDATGSIRVCIWPDDLLEVPPPVAEALKRKGTPVRLSGEVAVFRERVELHVKDGASVSLITAGAPSAPAPAGQTAPTAPQGFAVPAVTGGQNVQAAPAAR